MDAQTEARAKQLLAALPCVRVDYHEWLRCGMALHRESGGEPDGLALWDSWSREDVERYREGECRQRWKGFRHDEGGVGIGSMFQIAAQYGITFGGCVRLHDDILDSALSAADRLLVGIVRALNDGDGHLCRATNTTLGKWLHCDAWNVSKHVRACREAGWIRCVGRRRRVILPAYDGWAAGTFLKTPWEIVKDTELQPAEKIVLATVLAWNFRGSSPVSNQVLARNAGLKERSLRQVLADMIQKGLLQSEGSTSRRILRSTYQIDNSSINIA